MHEVRDDRWDLDQVADPAHRLADRADQPQDIEVARRVVVEEVARVEPVEALGGEIRGPEAERRQVATEPGTREQICKNDLEGEAEREDDQDRANGPLDPGRPRRRSRASLVPTGYGASHRGTAPARAWKVDRSVAQGGPDDPKADSLTSAPSDGRWDRRRDLAVGVVLGVIAFGIYMATQTDRFYDHFVWQASAFLEGQAAIRYPVESSASGIGNGSSRTCCRSPRPTA